MSGDGSPVNLNRLFGCARFFCKGCVPERRFWHERDLVEHIVEVRNAPGYPDKHDDVGPAPSE